MAKVKITPPPIDGTKEDPKKKGVKVAIKKPAYDMDAEFQSSYNKPINYDNRPANEVALSAATKTGIDPGLLYSSAYQEGMNKAILKPDEISEAYDNATKAKRIDQKTYPVDGFYNYGLDTFGDRYEDLKKKGYLPADFTPDRFQQFEILNEIEERNKKAGKPFKMYKSAAFKNNEDALIAKGAILRDTIQSVQDYAKSKGIELDEKAKNYFTLAGYNAGFGNAKKMIDEYVAAKDKDAFIEGGQTSLKAVHKNVLPRLKRAALATRLLTPQQQQAAPAVQQPAPSVSPSLNQIFTQQQ